MTKPSVCQSSPSASEYGVFPGTKSDSHTVSTSKTKTAATDLTEPQRKHLKRLAHHRRPIVQTGANGLTDAVLVEIERGLNDHELIKVRLVAGDRDERSAMIAEICERTASTLVQRIGHVAVLYRPHPKKPAIELPQAAKRRSKSYS